MTAGVGTEEDEVHPAHNKTHGLLRVARLMHHLAQLPCVTGTPLCRHSSGLWSAFGNYAFDLTLGHL